MTPKVKICCISSLAEARLAIAHGADAIGLVGHMPSGPGVIDDDLIREIAEAVEGVVETFLLTSETRTENIVRHHHRVGTSTIQIVDRLDFGSHSEIRNALPNTKLVQVVHVTGESAVDDALAAAETADFVLLDSGDPNLAVKELGGTGRTHNWETSRRIVEHLKKPVFLAGGLTPDNVKRAIKRVRPFGVDICSGVRTNGALDPAKLGKFFERVMRS